MFIFSWNYFKILFSFSLIIVPTFIGIFSKFPSKKFIITMITIRMTFILPNFIFFIKYLSVFPTLIFQIIWPSIFSTYKFSRIYFRFYNNKYLYIFSFIKDIIQYHIINLNIFLNKFKQKFKLFFYLL